MRKKSRERALHVNERGIVAVVSAFFLSVSLPFCAEPVVGTPAQQVSETTDSIMGDWQGTFTQRNKRTSPLAAQVIALGKGKYHATLLPEFDKRTTPVASLEGLTSGSAVRFMGWGDVSSYRGPDWDGLIRDGKFAGSVPAREGGTFEMQKVVRLSPTLGAKPPAGAVVLFDGTNFDQWETPAGRPSPPKTAAGKPSPPKPVLAQPTPVKWKIVNDAAIASGGTIVTKKKFGNFNLHLEFRTPFMPEAREQSRGNSGVLFHGLEIQVLDTYGLEGRSKECGGIYNRVAPLVNMCAPPMQWQTYDVTIRTPDKSGNARLTVLQNGVKIHDDLDVGRPIAQPDSIRLQDHGNPVQYRNIWLVELP